MPKKLASSDSSEGSAAGVRPSRRGGRAEEPPPSSASEAAKRRPRAAAARLAEAARMKRAPLLPYDVVEAVYSAVAGEARKAARRRLAALFAKHDPDGRGHVSLARFRKCVGRAGVRLAREEDCDALARCFLKLGNRTAEDEDEDDARVDYVAFTDFACNTRDSAQLSELADQMRRAIDKYDRKRGARRLSSSVARFSIGDGLKRLDRAKQGWISSERVERFFDELGDGDGPAFALSGQQVAALVDRFEYEYEKSALGFDYVQFSQWLQPLLHLDVKQLHARVKQLVLQANKRHGWDLGEVFEAIDEDRDGEIDALELKEALLEMGLPLTDAQIRALVDEYDANGDGQIQFAEFVSLFAPQAVGEGAKGKTKAKAGALQKEKDSEDDGNDSLPSRTKTRGKRNVRNTFSWGIAKAFARKKAAQSGRSTPRQPSARGKKDAESSSESSKSGKRTARRGKAAASSSSEASEATKRDRRKKPKATRERSSSELSSPRGGADKAVKKRHQAAPDNQSEGSSSDAAPVRKPRRKPPRAKTLVASPTDSEEDASKRKQPEKTKVRGSKKPSDSEAKEQSSTESTGEPGKKRRARIKSERRSKSPSHRRERLKSVASERSARNDARTRPRSPSKRPSRSHSSRSLQRLHRNESARSTRTSPKRRQRRSSRAQNSKARRERSKSRTRRESSTSPHEWQGDSVGDSDSSASGIDAEQLRQMKRSSRRRGSRDIASGGEGSDEDHGSHTESDAEYYRHLKRALRRAFDFFDLDKSDAIEKRELDHILRALGHDVTPKELEAELKRADLDRNGRLDFHEFAAFVKRQLQCKAYYLTQKREMEIRHAFEALDTDKNGVLDEKEFEYMVYKVLQVELSVEEQDALLDFVDTNGDGAINEEEFIAFMKTMEDFYKRSGGAGTRSIKRQNRFLAQLDGTSRLACSAMKKLVRGAPLDIDRNLLMFFDIPTNFRPAISSAATCRALNANTMAHALSFPSPHVVTALAHSGQRLLDTRDASMRSLIVRRDDTSIEQQILQSAEGLESQAIVSLKRATGVPKPFDTREDDVVKRCVHVCLFQEREEAHSGAGPRFATKTKSAGSGVVLGNVHEVPVFWQPSEEDVWEFSRKTTKEDKYKFLLRTNSVNDRLYLLVEFIVHLKMPKHERRRSKRVAKRSDPLRVREKLWGGTAHAPVDIEQDEILRRRTGWRAVANLFAKPTPPAMGVKSVSIDAIPDDLQKCVPKMPPTILAPFVALPILAEYMTLMQSMLTTTTQSSSVLMCDPVLQLLPKIVDDHEALTVFRRVFDAEMGSLKSPEQRQLKFRELVLRMWPTFVDWRDRLPPSLLTAMTTRHLPIAGADGASSKRLSTAAADAVGASMSTSEMRSTLLQTVATGKLRLQDVPVPSAPFHVREVAFQRRL